MINVVDLWQSSHHVVAHELSEGVKVEVAIPCVPPLDVIIVERNEAHRLDDVELEDIQPISRPRNLGE